MDDDRRAIDVEQATDRGVVERDARRGCSRGVLLADSL
jgi:hypothetical protein